MEDPSDTSHCQSKDQKVHKRPAFLGKMSRTKSRPNTGQPEAADTIRKVSGM